MLAANAASAASLRALPTRQRLPLLSPQPLASSQRTAPHLVRASAVSSEGVATALGYLVGAGSLALYTPIVWRVRRQGDASGLTLSTWWLKLASYSCSDVYSIAQGYPISTYVETLVITLEAALVLGLVAFYQRRLDAAFALGAAALAAAWVWALADAPPQALTLAQASATALNTGAVLPQLAQNARRREAGGRTGGQETAGPRSARRSLWSALRGSGLPLRSAVAPF